MLGFNVFAADSAGGRIACHLLDAGVRRAALGKAGKLKPPMAGYADTLPLEYRVMLRSVLSSSAIGSPPRSRRPPKPSSPAPVPTS
jgi:hypothetical protein